MRFVHCFKGVFLVCVLSAATWAGQGHAVSRAFRETVEADWARQEQRLGRAMSSPQTILNVMDRAGRLLTDLSGMVHARDFGEERVDLLTLKSRANEMASLDTPQRVRLYQDLRWFARNLALRNPLLAKRPILFMQRRRFVCQMLHEYLGYYYDYEDISGGGIYRLDQPGWSFATQDLNQGRLGRGNYATLALSHDTRTIYFAFAARSSSKPDYYSDERNCFHIFAMDTDGGNLRQITRGPDDDFDPCPLPDGGLAFMSSSRGGFTRCNNPWEPLPAHTLHRLDPTLTKRRTLSFHETSEWHPSVLHDGRIVYIRWDYVDRSAANFHGLWITNPDGSASEVLFGNYTMRINACYQPKAIPNSHKLVFLAGAHHADVGGSLVLLDPHRIALDPETGQDSLEAIEVLTPEVCFPEAP
ncbi:MAG: hypothetical protein GY809_16555, partial [Planctomycetes bacterium]|nr:hypothetical protein [Planctomycetota bacterium]